ncbi:hypothetical protein BY996DRAFT_6518737 [Phakopsora pachyrhizi]|nr:hypothetical protein BY996DRAFT_6518737 [Phakopsora pachyrhizi]
MNSSTSSTYLSTTVDSNPQRMALNLSKGAIDFMIKHIVEQDQRKVQHFLKKHPKLGLRILLELLSINTDTELRYGKVNHLFS